MALVAGALALVALLVWLVWWSPVLSVRQVQVEGLPAAEARAVTQLAAVERGTPLARVDTDAAAARVRQRITVAEVSVDRSWPSTVTIRAVPRTPVLVVKNPQGQLEVVDIDGVAYTRVATRPPGVPLVTATSAKGTSQEALRSALSLVRALPASMADDVTEIRVGSADLVTFQLGRQTVVWGGQEQPERKVAILRALLPTKARTIDVSAPDTPVTR